jgi:4-hydroxy-tetrahydrodipicolinate synthase
MTMMMDMKNKSRLEGLRGFPDGSKDGNKMDFRPYGVIPPLVTPLTGEGKLDVSALRKMINHLIKNGVHGVFPAGTTGEFYGMMDAEYRELLEVVVDEVAGRVPVYAGVNHITTRGAVNLTRIAEECKVDALSILTPMFISPTQEDLVRHFTAIAGSTNLPILMYNNKPKTNVDITPQSVLTLSDVPNIIGIKDSTGDMTNTEEYLRLTRHKDFHVMMGRDTLIYAALCYGASGAIASCSNVAPRIAADIYDKYVAGDLAGALEAQFKLAPLRIAFGIGTFPAVIKEGLAMQGLDVGASYEPVGRLKEHERESLRKILTELELI